MALAIALVLLVIGTVAFHFLSPWWFTPIASNWQTMDDTVNLTFVVTGIVFVAVNLFMAYAVYRYRHRKDREQRAEYRPEDRKLEWILTLVTTVGVVAMLAPGLKVLFVSGYPDDVLGGYGLIAAELNLLLKPFTPSRLRTKVREVIDGYQKEPALH